MDDHSIRRLKSWDEVKEGDVVFELFGTYGKCKVFSVEIDKKNNTLQLYNVDIGWTDTTDADPERYHVLVREGATND